MRTILGRLAVVSAAAAISACLAVPAWAEAPRPATLTILHGLPKFTADVYVNGTLTLDGFEPESVTDPITLPAGTYDVAIRDVGAPATSTPAVEGTLVLHAGQNYSAIAHLDGGGGPSLALFQNDLSSVAPGTARLVVRNTADAGAIHIRLDGDAVGGAVAEGHEHTISVAPGRPHVTVVAADGSTLLAGTRVTMSEGTSTVLYLVGSLEESTLDLMAQRFDDLASAPGDVLTGSGGLGADSPPSSWVALGALGALAAVGLLLVRRSGHRRALPLAAALLAAVALSPAAWGSRPEMDVGTIPRTAAAARPDRVPAADPTASRPTSATAIAVHSARLTDLASVGTGAPPTRIRIPALGVSGAIVPVGVESGSDRVQIPADVRTAGWYRFGPRPGAAGSSVLVGHVSSADQGAGLFYRLRELGVGARIEIGYGDGSARAFVVRARREYPKADLPADVFARSGSARLVLVTCGGPYDAATGHYLDNVVLYAVPSTGT